MFWGVLHANNLLIRLWARSEIKSHGWQVWCHTSTWVWRVTQQRRSFGMSDPLHAWIIITVLLTHICFSAEICIVFSIILSGLSHIGNSGVKNRGHDEDIVCRVLYHIVVLYWEAGDNEQFGEITREYFEVTKALVYSVFVICFLIKFLLWATI